MLYYSDLINHMLFHCKQSGNPREQYIRYRTAFRKIRPFASLSTCSWCFLPPNLCEKWVQKKGDVTWSSTSRECSYPDIILSIFVVALSHSIFQQQYSDRLQSVGISTSEYGDINSEIRYLGESIEWADIEVSRLFEVFTQAFEAIVD